VTRGRADDGTGNPLPAHDRETVTVRVFVTTDHQPGDRNMRAMTKSLVNFLKQEDGPTAVEYAVMLALIIVVCIAAITTLGSNANSTFSFVGSTIKPPAASSSSSS
jgi:pilus assembly protein Flp/PilA